MTIFKYSMMAAGSLLLGGFAGLTPMTTANAADLGGNCCSDLEQRVAELEATAARKGNTKVSLTVYGQVNRALLAWDDGKDSDAYIVDPTVSSTRFGFIGKAKLKQGWSAGYNIEIELQDDPSQGMNQDTANMLNHSSATGFTSSGANLSSGNSLRLRQSNWYIEGEQAGRLTLGLQNMATKDGVNLNLSNSLSTAENYYAYAFKVRSHAGGTIGSTALAWGTFANALDTGREHMVRYDTPSVYGFILSAAWGENDAWDAAIRFAREWNGIKIAAYGGYAWTTDAAMDNILHTSRNKRDQWTGSASMMHVASGLYLNVTGGEQSADARKDVNGHIVDASYLYGQFGINRKFLPYGVSTIYGEVAEYNDFGVGSILHTTDNTADLWVKGSNVNRWGVGVTQALDVAAMDIYAQYHHYSLEAKGTDDAAVRTEDWDAVLTGARIKF